MTPRNDELDHFFRDLTLPQKQEIHKGLDPYDCPGSCRLFWNGDLPRWYPLVWLPVAAEPSTGVTCLCSLGLVSAIALVSLLSYAHWGRYSYVYKSPIIGDTLAASFSGDYWGACLTEAVKALPGRGSDATPVNADDYSPSAWLAEARYRESRAAAIAGFGSYRFVVTLAAIGPGLGIVFNRAGMIERVWEKVKSGQIEVPWSTPMPPGEPACSSPHPPTAQCHHQPGEDRG